ncbi:acyl carrier protein [Geothermobacter hydrogeniphilus]|uniref:Acyl carrier protein n=1 Tax=Geothermobacter hydrogeniphilus TaxID=1969733 RepID=A0A2K2HBD5_9BACT|nr:phosphopantetheine-binding protein [Geothermobacter hydrogeniphilus]PNU20622.1 acyl carrier protein [Geothermobacter hydrogeniphilus]
MSETSEFTKRLKQLIVETCNIPDAPEDVPEDAPLIGPDSPLDLDSLDAVEVVVAVQKAFGVRIGGEEGAREVLQSLRTLAEFILREQNKR